MGVAKYQLWEPTQRSLKRIREVQFYLFLQSFLFKYNHDNQYVLGLIEDLALLYDCKPHIITTLINHFKSPAYMPDKEEIVVSAFLLGIPVRGVTRITRIGTDTYYRYLKGYIAKKQPQLEARLSDDYRAEMEKFLKAAVVMFEDVSMSLRGTDIYDGPEV